MTFTEEFIPVQDGGFDTPRYPTAFGLTFSPSLIGVLLALVGFAGGLYLLLNQALPAWNRNRDQAREIERKEQLAKDQEASLAERPAIEAEQAAALAEFDQVMGLYASESVLDTLLLDISSNLPNPKELLTSFAPDGGIEVITDGSLGEPVNGMLKRQSYLLKSEGSYQQTEELIKKLELLQPLLRVTNFQTQAEQLVQLVNVGPFGAVQVTQKEPNLATGVTVEALIQRSREEIEADRQAAAAEVPPAQ